MQLTIDLTPTQEAQLLAVAESEGLDPQTLLQRLVSEQLPAAMERRNLVAPAVPISAENQAAIALLDSWIAEDATDDPEELRRAEEELAEFKRQMNANRVASADTLVFP